MLSTFLTLYVVRSFLSTSLVEASGEASQKDGGVCVMPHSSSNRAREALSIVTTSGSKPHGKKSPMKHGGGKKEDTCAVFAGDNSEKCEKAKDRGCAFIDGQCQKKEKEHMKRDHGHGDGDRDPDGAAKRDGHGPPKGGHGRGESKESHGRGGKGPKEGQGRPEGGHGSKEGHYKEDACTRAENADVCHSDRMASFECQWVAPSEDVVSCEGRNMICQTQSQSGTFCRGGQKIGQCANGGTCCLRQNHGGERKGAMGWQENNQKEKMEIRKKLIALKEWCETEANCTNPQTQTRGCYLSEDTGTCPFHQDRMNVCAQFSSKDECAAGAPKTLTGKTIGCEWHSKKNICDKGATKENDKEEMTEEDKKTNQMQKVKEWCETEANCTNPRTHARGCYSNEDGTCSFYPEKMKRNQKEESLEKDECSAAKEETQCTQMEHCAWYDKNGKAGCYNPEARKKRGEMQKKGKGRAEDKADMEKKQKEFTGACVSQLSWCFQAGKDESKCKPLVESGQCAFVEIGDYKGCVAKKESFLDECYQQAENSEEDCTTVPGRDIKCTFVTSEDVKSAAEAQGETVGIVTDDLGDANGAFAFQASWVFVLLLLSY